MRPLIANVVLKSVMPDVFDYAIQLGLYHAKGYPWDILNFVNRLVSFSAFFSPFISPGKISSTLLHESISALALLFTLIIIIVIGRTPLDCVSGISRLPR